MRRSKAALGVAALALVIGSSGVAGGSTPTATAATADTTSTSSSDVTVTATTTDTTTTPAKLDGMNLYLDEAAMAGGGTGPADPSGCDSSGTSTLTVNGRGTIELGSPYYPGTFTVTATATLGPQSDTGQGSGVYGFPARTAAIAGWTQTYHIVSGTTTIDVTTQLSDNPFSFAPNVGSCYGQASDGPGGESLFGWSDAYSGTIKGIQATTTYTATISDGTSSWSTSGTTFTRLREMRALLASAGEQMSHTPQVSTFSSGTTPVAETSPSDGDADGHPDASDNCPDVANPGQEDADGDGQGDACEAPSTGAGDRDADGVPDASDNCPDATNPDQADLDGDGQGDVCDADIDGDGLTNIIEIWLGCDPYKADSDGDGVGDWVEVVIGVTSPVLADTHQDDGTGGDHGYLLRIIEEKCGCVLPDTDTAGGGGFRIWVEYWYFGGPYDPDVDGGGGYSTLVDYIWHLCGCGPDDPDGNGIPTTVERHYDGGGLLWIIHACGCLPWEEDAGAGGGMRTVLLTSLGGGADQDTDGDGIIDVIELMIGCNPHAADTDGDGLNDRIELLFGSDPTKTDTDGDGMSDKVEYELGCDPRNPDSDGDGLPDGSDPAPRAMIVEGSCAPTVSQPVVPVGTAITATATFTGHNGGVKTGEIEWGDGTSTTPRTGAGTLTESKTYTTPGVYVIGCKVVDVTGGTQRTEYRHVVVYDASAGFVTGGGWIDSPAGAYTPDPAVAGPARFGFVSQYKKGATVPTGQTEFQFQAAGMNFHAGVYEWLVVTGNSTRAQYKGTGTINGSGEYGFLLTAYDLGSGQNVDKLRLKIWDKSTGAVVYDNRLGSPDEVDGADPQLLSQGQIVIHSGGKK